MFKSSENLRLAAEMRALQRVAAPWREARTRWFDGTPESIEARLAATDRVLTQARAGFTAAHLSLTTEAETARRELLAAKHRLLTDFLDDGARAFKGSKRVAGGDSDYAREESEFWKRHVEDTGPGEDDEYREGSRRVAEMHDADPWEDEGEFPDMRHWDDSDDDPDPSDPRLVGASTRTAGDGPGPGSIDDLMFPNHRQPTGADYLAEMDPEDRPGYGEGGIQRCKHCEETIEEDRDGYAHYNGHNRVGEPHFYESDHPAEPEDDDDDEHY